MISSPESNVKLPSDIQNAIEAGRNNVTVLSAEASRLDKLCRQFEKEIRVLTERESYVKECVSKLELDEKELKVSIDKLTSKKSDAEKYLKDKADSLMDREIKVKDSENKVDKRLDEISRTEYQQKLDTFKLNKRNELISLQEEQIVKLEKNLVNALGKINEYLTSTRS